MDARHLFPLVVGLLANLLVLGASGLLPLDDLSAAAIHHVYHILLPTMAFVIFVVYVASDIRRHGWPTFTWSLR